MGVTSERVELPFVNSSLWRMNKDRRRRNGCLLWLVVTGRSVVALLLSAQLYMCVNQITPVLYSDLPTRILFQGFVVFTVFQVVINWIMAMTYSSTYDLYLHVFESTWLQRDFCGETENGQHLRGQLLPEYDTAKMYPRRYCEICRINKPFRTHHCKICNVCILKRDHHCYLTGNCIGLKNQKYFIVGAFYTTIVSIVCGYLCAKYLYLLMYVSTTASWFDLFLPVTFIRWIFGCISGFNSLAILFCYIDVFFAVEGARVFLVQMFLAVNGMTLHELKKRRAISNVNTTRYNLHSVFGKYWLLNFIFPVSWGSQSK
ncbi:palmitoyltransferase ZDHHC22-like [Mya arenaria]|uniref:palmitoyltransferase ZDHHC22-like n=1 Tax=Mya arenaria TaxID=6604 RepID=UPI0022E2F0AF|nr:palmitoyltransferase ZDHHC22-like [Mya arenaria]XP_052792977.1 palmitoyltransferase ZDHHC22-like [Mya arenaria]